MPCGNTVFISNVATEKSASYTTFLSLSTADTNFFLNNPNSDLKTIDIYWNFRQNEYSKPLFNNTIFLLHKSNILLLELFDLSFMIKIQLRLKRAKSELCSKSMITPNETIAFDV